MLDQYPHNRGARFAIFMATASMALALIAVNLATNVRPSSLHTACLNLRPVSTLWKRCHSYVSQVHDHPEGPVYLLSSGHGHRSLEDSQGWNDIFGILIVSRMKSSLFQWFSSLVISGYGYWLAPGAAILLVDYL